MLLLVKEEKKLKDKKEAKNVIYKFQLIRSLIQ